MIGLAGAVQGSSGLGLQRGRLGRGVEVLESRPLVPAAVNLPCHCNLKPAKAPTLPYSGQKRRHINSLHRHERQPSRHGRFCRAIVYLIHPRIPLDNPLLARRRACPPTPDGHMRLIFAVDTVTESMTRRRTHLESTLPLECRFVAGGSSCPPVAAPPLSTRVVVLGRARELEPAAKQRLEGGCAGCHDTDVLLEAGRLEVSLLEEYRCLQACKLVDRGRELTSPVSGSSCGCDFGRSA
jgi:hypothetical protein